MSYNGIERIIKATTLASTGIDVSFGHRRPRPLRLLIRAIQAWLQPCCITVIQQSPKIITIEQKVSTQLNRSEISFGNSAMGDGANPSLRLMTVLLQISYSFTFANQVRPTRVLRLSGAACSDRHGNAAAVSGYANRNGSRNAARGKAASRGNDGDCWERFFFSWALRLPVTAYG